MLVTVPKFPLLHSFGGFCEKNRGFSFNLDLIDKCKRPMQASIADHPAWLVDVHCDAIERPQSSVQGKQYVRRNQESMTRYPELHRPAHTGLGRTRPTGVPQLTCAPENRKLRCKNLGFGNWPCLKSLGFGFRYRNNTKHRAYTVYTRV